MVVRIGILQCDSLDPPHVEIDGDYDMLFRDLLDRPDVEIVVHRADQGDLPGSPADADAWLVPGSRQSVYDELDWILDLRRLVERLLAAERRLIGVCFGHQMIAQQMGAPVAKSEGGWNVGTVTYDLHSTPPGEPPVHPADHADRFSLIASHQDQVLELPDGADLLASAATCPVAAYTVDDRVLAVQAHPEFGPELAASLYQSRVERLGAEVVADALASLVRPPDRRRVSDWIVDFARA